MYTSLLAAVFQVDQVRVDYARTSKKIDIKKLKSKMWEVITQEPKPQEQVHTVGAGIMWEWQEQVHRVIVGILWEWEQGSCGSGSPKCKRTVSL